MKEIVTMVRYVVMFFVLYFVLVWLEYIALRKYNVHKYFSPLFYEDPFLESRIIPYRISIQSSSIIFTGLARNIGLKIKETIENCVVLGTFFKSYKIILFENDSSDDTRKIIQSIAETNPNILLIDCEGYKDCKFNLCNLYEYGIMNKNRIDRMTFFRNVYMTIIQKHFSSYDYMCVVDFDLDGIIPLYGLVHALNCPYDWSCICANGRSSVPGTFGMFTTMYDAMAFCKTKQDIQESKIGDRGMSHLFSKYLRLVYLSNVDSSYNESGFIPVLSAFNGLAIYKIKDLHGIFYKEGYSCEHISLHEQLVKMNKNIFIDLQFIVFAGHQGPQKITDFFKY
jgi:hypothetical protein